MKTFATLSVLILTVILCGCNETKKAIDIAGNVQLNGKYVVNQINGTTVVANNHPTLIFSALDKSIRGTTGCNSVFGKYTLDLYVLNFQDLAVSEKDCLQQNVKQTESQFLDALKNTGSYYLQDNVLTLYSKGDKKVLLTATKDANAQN